MGLAIGNVVLKNKMFNVEALEPEFQLLCPAWILKNVEHKFSDFSAVFS